MSNISRAHHILMVLVPSASWPHSQPDMIGWLAGWLNSWVNLANKLVDSSHLIMNPNQVAVHCFDWAVCASSGIIYRLNPFFTYPFHGDRRLHFETLEAHSSTIMMINTTYLPTYGSWLISSEQLRPLSNIDGDSTTGGVLNSVVSLPCGWTTNCSVGRDLGPSIFLE